MICFALSCGIAFYLENDLIDLYCKRTTGKTTKQSHTLAKSQIVVFLAGPGRRNKGATQKGRIDGGNEVSSEARLLHIA